MVFQNGLLIIATDILRAYNIASDTATALRCGSGVTACSRSCPNKTSLANSQTKQELRSHRNSTLSVISV